MQKRSEKNGLHSKHRQSREDRKDEFISSLVEFHKAQCFFVIAVQIAALTLMQKPNQTLQANMTVIPVTAAIGVQAPLFAYLAIAKYGRQSSYLLLLTVAAWILSSATMWDAFVILYVTGNVNYQVPAVPACGNHDLSNFCYTLSIWMTPSSYDLSYYLGIWYKVWIAIWSVSILVLFSTIASWIQLTDFPRLSNLTGSRFRSPKTMRVKWWKAWRYLNPEAEKEAWLFYLITGFLAASLCMEIYQLAYIWKLNLEDASNWTFGTFSHKTRRVWIPSRPLLGKCFRQAQPLSSAQPPRLDPLLLFGHMLRRNCRANRRCACLGGPVGRVP